MKNTSFYLFVLLAVACSKADIPAINCNTKTNRLADVKRLLPGTYEWAYTNIIYQVGSHVETPLNTGTRYRYIFKPGGQVYYFRNDTLQWNNNYVIDYEFAVTAYPSDSSIIVIIRDKQTGLRQDFFRPYVCSDSALFYNPYNSIDYRRFFKRN